MGPFANSMSVQLGKYHLVAEIARGGMGIVYLAVTQGPGGFSKLLVVKELKAELVDDQQFLAMFLEEARLAARLSHPNIVQTYEIAQEGDVPYIVMDYLDGVSLSRILRRKSPLWTRNHQLRVIGETLQGLHYAHTLKDFDGTPLGIVHRDVTPQNVFVTYDGQAKLVDFGIAKALDTRIETRTGILKGKPAYMAPEQITGAVDPRSDVFSAGVLLWEAAAGQRMWTQRSDAEVLASMLRGGVPSLREAAPDTPDALVAIVEKATAAKPDERYATAADLHEALEAFLATEPPVTLREVGRVLGEIFEADRARVRTVIEAHLASLRAGKVEERVPMLADAPSSATTPASETQASPGAAPAPVTKTLHMALPAEVAAAAAPPATAPAPQKKGRAWGPWLVVAGALVVAVIGYKLGSSRARPRETPVRITGSASAAPVASVSASTSASASAQPTASVVEDAGLAVSASATASAAPSASALLVEKHPTPRWPWSPGRPRTTAAPPASTEAPSAAAVGYLTLDTYPWTRVSMGGKVLGDTPLVRFPLAAGTHVLTLENTAEKVRTTTTVVVKSGETTSRRLAF